MAAKDKRKITSKFIESIKPPKKRGQQDEYFDSLCPGLSLRVGTSGKKVFTYLYRFNGKVKRATLGGYLIESGGKYIHSIEKARQEAARIRSMIEADTDPSLEKIKTKHTALDFKALHTKYIDEYAKPNKRTWKEDEQKLERNFIEWDTRKAASITRDEILDKIEYINQNSGPIAANRNRALILKLFKWARVKRLIPDNPALDVPKESERKRDRILTDDEIKLFWDGCGKIGYPFGPCFKLMLLTGRRRGSVASMSKPEIDLDNRQWAVSSEKDKSGKPQIVPLFDIAAKILNDVLENYNLESDYVFTTNLKKPVSGFSKAKTELDKLTGMQDWTLHDLRRTCRTNLPRLSVSPFIAKLTIGHTITGIDQVYDRYSYMPEKTEALQKWTDFINGLVTGESAKVVKLHG